MSRRDRDLEKIVNAGLDIRHNGMMPADGCPRCDGTGKICNVCGESPRSCGCEEDGEGKTYYDTCLECGGSGR